MTCPEKSVTFAQGIFPACDANILLKFPVFIAKKILSLHTCADQWENWQRNMCFDKIFHKSVQHVAVVEQENELECGPMPNVMAALPNIL